MKKNSNNETCFYGSNRPCDGGNQLVAEIQKLRARISELPPGSPRLVPLQEREQDLQTELYYMVERLLEKNAHRLYKKMKDLPLLYSEREDLVQEGAVAFLKAIDQFDLSQGTKFSTMVCRYVVTAITDQVRHETHYNHHKRKTDEEGDQPSRKEEPKMRIVSLDSIVAADEGGKEITLGDTIADEKSRLPEDVVIEREGRQKAKRFRTAARDLLPQARGKTLDDYADCGCSVAETARRQKRPYNPVSYELGQIRKTLRRELGGFNPAA